MHLQTKIEVGVVKDFINELDMLTLQIMLNSKQLTVTNAEFTCVNAARLKQFANNLKTVLVNPRIHGKVNHYLVSSVKRSLKCILSAHAVYSSDKIVISHPLEYTTFKTLARAEYFFTQLHTDTCTLADIHRFM